MSFVGSSKIYINLTFEVKIKVANKAKNRTKNTN
jgi:hypothetical protein